MNYNSMEGDDATPTEGLSSTCCFSNKKGIHSNLNIFWIVATCLCFWFLWIHGPIFLSTKDYIQPLLYVHLVGAYSIYLTCVHNTLLTPSTLDGNARPYHVWIGRIGLILGVVGFVAGFILVWFIYDYKSNLGFSIGITYGGTAQIYLEYVGYTSIKRYQEIKKQIKIQIQNFTQKEDYDNDKQQHHQSSSSLQDELNEQLIKHITSMINLFLIACGIPAMIRIVDTIGYIYLPIFIGLAYVISYYMIQSFTKKIAETTAKQPSSSSETSSQTTSKKANNNEIIKEDSLLLN